MIIFLPLLPNYNLLNVSPRHLFSITYKFFSEFLGSEELDFFLKKPFYFPSRTLFTSLTISLIVILFFSTDFLSFSAFIKSSSLFSCISSSCCWRADILLISITILSILLIDAGVFVGIVPFLLRLQKYNFSRKNILPPHLQQNSFQILRLRK